MASAGAFMFGLGAIPAGLLETRLGGKKLLVIYQIGSGLAALILVTAQKQISNHQIQRKYLQEAVLLPNQ